MLWTEGGRDPKEELDLPFGWRLTMEQRVRVDERQILTLKGSKGGSGHARAWLAHAYSGLSVTGVASRWLPVGKRNARRCSWDLSVLHVAAGERALWLCRIRRRTRDMSAQHRG